MKQINKYLEVGYCQCGQPLTAEHLSKWAYNQLNAAPDLLEACKMIINDAIWDGKEYSDLKKECLVKMETIEKARQAITKAEGKE